MSNESVNAGDIRSYFDPGTSTSRVYEAQTSATTGTTPPVHTTGTVTDDNVDWLFVRTLNSFTTTVKADTISANRTVQLPNRDGTLVTEDTNGAAVTDLIASRKVSGDQFAGRLRQKLYFLAFS